MYLRKNSKDFSQATVTDPDLAAVHNEVFAIVRQHGTCPDRLHEDENTIINNIRILHKLHKIHFNLS
jgi:hypothetical protein